MAEARSAARWPAVSAVLDGALEREPGERPAFLDAACRGDAPLRAEVDALLAAAARPPGFLDGSAPEFAAALLASDADASPNELAPGDRVGPFRVVRELGRGGMGAVHLAERDDPRLRQRVAVKRMRGGPAAAHLAERFLEERQILASLDHPGIARLADGGVGPDGVPWFAMEYVEGLPLDRYCDAHGLGVAERLELFRQVADAVAYAHRRLVVHCDLKPGNVLVGEDGRARLLDFGVARLLSAEPPAARVPMMTPAYASPEQRRGEPPTTAADVYALGLLLRRLLANHPRALRGDLEAIARRAADPDPARRYRSVEELAADLDRHAALLPVRARPASGRYRAGRFLRRNRWGVGAAAALVLLAIAFTGVAALQARRVAAERDRAQQVEAFLLGLLRDADLYAGSGRAATLRELLDAGTARLAAGEVRRPEARSRLFFSLGRAYHALGDYEPAIALLDSSYALERRMHGETAPPAIAVANQLADVLRVAGRHADAERLYGVVLAGRRRTFGDRSTEVARSLNGLAMVLRMQGRHSEAEHLLREALAIDRARAAEDPPALMQTLNNLGHVLRERGDLAAAEAFHRESLAARRAHWGPEHFEVSVALANLAGVLRDRGDLAGSDSLYRAVLGLRARLVGDDHPDLAADRAGYALLLHRRGELAPAEAEFRRALSVQRERLAAGHPATAATLAGLGEVLVDLGRPGEAAALLREALASRRANLPSGHPLIVRTQAILERSSRSVP